MSLNTLSFSPRRLRAPSLENIHPPVGSSSRRSTLLSSSFNLVATVIGGGVLSLPYAFATCGLATGVGFTVLAAVMADFSLYILCSCARRTGTQSYGDVARVCFGEAARIVVTVILFVFLMFVTTAFMILMRDIMASMVEFATGSTLSFRQNTTVLVVCVLVTFPFMLLKDLYSLRHNCYVGFVSVLLLMSAMIYRAIAVNEEDPDLFKNEAVLTSSDPFDSLFSFPLVALAFLSQFNMLSVHSSLQNPTRARLQKVIHLAIGACTVMFLAFGVSGYLYSYGDTKDNILLNFDPSDRVVLLGRFGLGITLIAGCPMIVLPCREAMLILPAQIRKWRYERSAITDDEKIPVLTGKLREREREREGEGEFEREREREGEFNSGIGGGEGEGQGDRLLAADPSFVTHFLSTLFIAVTCFTAASFFPGVSTVWR